MIPFVRIAVLLALCGFAAAQDSPPTTPPLENQAGADTHESEPAAADAVNKSTPWTLEIHPCVWYLGFSGDVTMPRTGGGSSEVDIDDLDLNSPQLSPYGEATLRKDRWLVGMRGFVFGADQNATVDITANLGNTDLTPGTQLQSSLDVWGVELEGGYTLLLNERSAMTGGGYKFRTRLDAIAGLRFLDVNFDSSVPSTAGDSPAQAPQSADAFAVQPLVGARVTADIYEQFSIILEITAGGQPFGDDTNYGFDIIVGGQWRPIPNVGLQVGYRSLFLGVSSGSGDDEFEFSGAGQGLYAGVTFSF